MQPGVRHPAPLANTRGPGPVTGLSGLADGRVALAHEWLAHRHGSEKTFEAMAQAFPEADLYALTLNPSVPFAFGGRAVNTTVLDRLPGFVRSRRELQLPLMPLAWRYASRQRYDVVVTSSHACVKGFRPGRDARHLCYCYTPMRYVWLSAVDSRRPERALVRAPAGAARAAFRRWDRHSVRWVDGFAAISTAVQTRVRDVYERDAVVIHPPVDTEWFTPADGVARRQSVALAVSRMVPYKRLDLAIRACRALDYKLIVAGSGPEEAALRALAAEIGADVTFHVSPDDATLRDLYRQASVVLFVAEEDFGIVTVEAQACGTPVVALGRGGSLDTVVPGVTGVLVAEQSVEAVAGGLEEVLRAGLDPAECRRHAERFAVSRFQDELREWVVA